MSPSSAPAAGAPDPKYAHVASDAAVERTVAHLKEHGFDVLVVPDAASARRAVLERVPAGASVLDLTSRTLEETGVVAALTERKDIDLVKARARSMDRKTQAAEIRRLTQAPDVVVGSVHALTEDGQALIASATGSQIGPYSSGAGMVLWVVGAQKIVPNLDEGMRRLERYALPLEDERARQAYGVGSGINRLLVFRREHLPGRTTVVIVRQKLGF